MVARGRRKEAEVGWVRVEKTRERLGKVWGKLAEDRKKMGDRERYRIRLEEEWGRGKLWEAFGGAGGK